MAGHNDEAAGVVDVGQPLDDLDPVDVGHDDVEDNDVRLEPHEGGHEPHGIVQCFRGKPHALGDTSHQHENVIGIVYHQNAGHGRYCAAVGPSGMLRHPGAISWEASDLDRSA